MKLAIIFSFISFFFSQSFNISDPNQYKMHSLDLEEIFTKNFVFLFYNFYLTIFQQHLTFSQTKNHHNNTTGQLNKSLNKNFFLISSGSFLNNRYIWQSLSRSCILVLYLDFRIIIAFLVLSDFIIRSSGLFLNFFLYLLFLY